MTTNIEKQWNVEIKKLAGSSHLDIWVNGEKWATGFKESRGPHGYFYTFADSYHHSLCTPGRTKRTEHSAVRIWSDKHAQSQTKERVAPIEERIKQFIVSMIVAGELSSPEVLKRQAAADHERRVAANDKAEAAITKAFDDCAANVLSEVSLGEETKALLRARIVEAMKWAQTQ